MPLPYSHLIDKLATAFLQAMAATAGCTIAVQRRDYGIDGTFRYIAPDSGHHETGFPVDFQLKATALGTFDKNDIVLDLKVANYNKIVTRPARAAPYYLILVCFPPKIQNWLRISDEELVLAARAYWWTGVGTNAQLQSTKRIRIPTIQRLNNDSISNMFAVAEARYQL
jgi:hypothetical protein